MIETMAFGAPAQFRSILIAAAAVLCLPACASPEAGGDAVQLEQEITSSVGVIRVKASGTGCPGGTWRARVSSDRTRVTLLFDRFSARAGKTAIRECEVQVTIAGNDGQQYSVSDLTVRGGAYGAEDATVATHLSWAGSEASEETVTTTLSDSFEETQEVAEHWSACRGTRELRLRPQLSVPRGSAALDEQEIHLRRRRCIEGGAPDASTSPANSPDASVPPPPHGPRLIEDESCGKLTVRHDDDGISVSFGDFSVERTSDTLLTSRTCHLLFSHVFEAGKSYAIQSYVIEGTASVVAGTSAAIRSIPYVLGAGWPKGANGEVKRAEVTIKGPYTGPIMHEASFSDVDLTFAPCDGLPQLGLDVTPAIVDVDASQTGGTVRLGSVRAIRFKEKACAR